MRILGIDYGTVRIGVAMSDSLLITASPVTVIERKQGAVREPIAKICEIITANEVQRIVVGLPKNMNNTEGALEAEVRRFAEKLGKAASVPVVLRDERLSSAQAEKALIEAGSRRAKRKEKIDGVAACLILQSYLESLHFEHNNPNKQRSLIMDNENTDFDGIEEIEETEEFDLIVLEDEETGEDVELVIVDSVELEDFSYLLVVPMQEFDDECPNASIIKEIKEENGEYVYETVDSDVEFEEASKYFQEDEEEE